MQHISCSPYLFNNHFETLNPEFLRIFVNDFESGIVIFLHEIDIIEKKIEAKAVKFEIRMKKFVLH